MKKMIVCIKQIMDPEAPADSFEIDAAKKAVIPGPNAAQVISPFDEHALEAALRIKDEHGGKITVLSLGYNLRREVLKKSLAMGADELVLLDEEAFVDGDSWSTAMPLAMAVKKIGDFDLIFCGRQSADWDRGQIGSGIAEILGIPVVTLARKIEPKDDTAIVERVVEDGFELVEVSLPAVITVSNEIGEARYPKLKGMMKAKKVDPVVWGTADINVQPDQVGLAGRKSKLLKLYERPVGDWCEFINGESPEETGVNLAVKLRESKML